MSKQKNQLKRNPLFLYIFFYFILLFLEDSNFECWTYSDQVLMYYKQPFLFFLHNNFARSLHRLIDRSKGLVNNTPFLKEFSTARTRANAQLEGRRKESCRDFLLILSRIHKGV